MGRPKRAAARAAEAEAEANKKAKAGLAVGDQLPDDLPELETDETVGKDSKTLKLQDVAKESGIVVFVYPKALGFNAKLDKFASLGYKVFGLSADRPKPQSNWKAKNSFKYTLLSDPQSTVISAFGFSKSGKGIHRSHIVIEKGGKVKDVRLGVKPEVSVVLALETVESAPGEPLAAEPATAPEEEGNVANGVKEAPAAEEPEAAAAAEAAPEATAQASTEEPGKEEAKPDEPEGGEGDKPEEEAAEPQAEAAAEPEKATEVAAVAEAADEKPAEPAADAEAPAEAPAEAAAGPAPDKAPEEVGDAGAKDEVEG